MKGLCYVEEPQVITYCYLTMTDNENFNAPFTGRDTEVMVPGLRLFKDCLRVHLGISSPLPQTS